MNRRLLRCSGFSLVELLIATFLVAIVSLGAFRLGAHGLRVASSRPAAGDLQQRLRVAAEMLRRDLQASGAGLVFGDAAGPLAQLFAPIVPARVGALAPDPELSALSDRVTLFYVPDGAWSTRPVVDMPDPSAAVPIALSASGCPAAGLCGFDVGSRAAIADRSGLAAGHDVFSVTGIAGALSHAAPNRPFSRAYAAASSVVFPIVQRVYYLDRAQHRLMLYDGYQSALPLVDHVTDLRFAYYADPSPLAVARPPDGEGNCVFAAASPPIPLLADLGGVSLRPLAMSAMTDGPFCGASPGRFDGDLLRIRRVRVTLRLEQAGSDGSVPDYEITFDVSPRNLAPSEPPSGTEP